MIRGRLFFVIAYWNREKYCLTKIGKLITNKVLISFGSDSNNQVSMIPLLYETKLFLFL